MSEWWTYTLSDLLMFAPRTYYRLFALYNAAIWPAQPAALSVGLALPFLLRHRLLVAGILAGLWLWVAWGFLYSRYATIHWAAPWFALLFVAQAVLLVALRPRFGVRRRRAGLTLFGFALIGQPLLGLALGRDGAAIELFGLAPDPTAVGSLGLLLTAAPRWPLLFAPVLWCAVTGATLWAMEAPDALVSPAAALLVLLLLRR